MEKNKCKVCLRSFANGRSLGGHMKSHQMNLLEEETIQHGDSSESAPSSSSEQENEAGLYYGLRENPKRSVKLVDPEFAFNDARSVSVVLQDRESETESSKINPTRRRSKRKIRKATNFLDHYPYYVNKKVKFNSSKVVSCNKTSTTTESWTEPEPVSSISDTTTEEDVAFCLMMLSRDNKWKNLERVYEPPDENDHKEEDDDVDESDEEESQETNYKFSKSSKGKYKCETCNSVFKSYQALGGHRASHKKMKLANSAAAAATRHHQTQSEININKNIQNAGSKKVHECPFCYRVFSSGQALGGHKRTHGLSESATQPPAPAGLPPRPTAKINWIDLNLPAAVDDDDNFSSQIEHSAVSDAEFVRR